MGKTIKNLSGKQKRVLPINGNTLFCLGVKSFVSLPYGKNTKGEI